MRCKATSVVKKYTVAAALLALFLFFMACAPLLAAAAEEEASAAQSAEDAGETPAPEPTTPEPEPVGTPEPAYSEIEEPPLRRRAAGPDDRAVAGGDAFPISAVLPITFTDTNANPGAGDHLPGGHWRRFAVPQRGGQWFFLWHRVCRAAPGQPGHLH